MRASASRRAAAGVLVALTALGAQVANADGSSLSKRGKDKADVDLQDPVVEAARDVLAPRHSRGVGDLKRLLP